MIGITRHHKSIRLMPKPATKPRIVLAEDHLMIAEGIVKLLENDCELIGVVADGQALISATKKTLPDLILVDISLPLLNGLEATRQIKKSFPDIPVIILTMHTDNTLIHDARSAGVSGYLLKESAASELLHAIKEVLRGKTFFSATILENLGDHHGPAEYHETSIQSEVPLTPRQREILQLIAEGRSNKKMASILGLAVKTVEFHKTRLMRTLEIHSIPELTKYAIAHRMITL